MSTSAAFILTAASSFSLGMKQDGRQEVEIQDIEKLTYTFCFFFAEKIDLYCKQQYWQ